MYEDVPPLSRAVTSTASRGGAGSWFPRMNRAGPPQPPSPHPGSPDGRAASDGAASSYGSPRAGSPASRKDRRQARLSACRIEQENVVLPEPFNGAVIQRAYSLKDVPTPEALSSTLASLGISTESWGSGNTKNVSKYWKEIKESEAGLEVWRTTDGQVRPVRVTYVLRAKVSSPDAYARGIFLFNTWQQYGDGRKRTRNGLLSEKLTTAEMPLGLHLHEVCERAVTEEEMQRIVDAGVRIGPHCPAPVFDPDYVCPLTVVHEEFVDHTVEIEASKSYPGLLTAYHLYTVDIVCEGLPTVDFNTLEFEHPGADGKRKLKYIHAWVWLEWSMIQRYLFEGSEVKERKSKGSFQTAKELEAWLSQFDVDLESWGVGQWKSIDKLWAELESSNTQLERWGRNDGVPLLMRVVHVLQMKVTSLAEAANQKFLFQTWNQGADGRIRSVNRTMARKLCAADLPFDAKKFESSARHVVQEMLSYLADAHARLNPADLPTKQNSEKSDVKVVNVSFSDHRFDLEDSPSFKDMTTMYHLYTVEVVCEGLPSSNFSSIMFDSQGVPSALGWKWVTWQETLDILHQRAQILERRETFLTDKLAAASESCKACLEELSQKNTVGRSSSSEDSDKASRLAQQLQEIIAVLDPGENLQQNFNHSPSYARIPPSMLANLADRKGVSDDFLDGAYYARQQQMQRQAQESQEEPFSSYGTSHALQRPAPVREVATLATTEEFVMPDAQRCRGSVCGFLCGPPPSDAGTEFR